VTDLVAHGQVDNYTRVAHQSVRKLTLFLEATFCVGLRVPNPEVTVAPVCRTMLCMVILAVLLVVVARRRVQSGEMALSFLLTSPFWILARAHELCLAC